MGDFEIEFVKPFEGPFVPAEYGKAPVEVYFTTATRKISLNEFVSAMEEILDRPIGEKKESEKSDFQ